MIAEGQDNRQNRLHFSSRMPFMKEFPLTECCEKSVTRSVTRGCYERVLREGVTRGCYERVLRESVTRNVISTSLKKAIHSCPNMNKRTKYVQKKG